MNLFKKLESSSTNYNKNLPQCHKYGEPYLTKILATIISKFNENFMLDFIHNFLNLKDKVDSVKSFEVKEEQVKCFELDFDGRLDIGIQIKQSDGKMFYIIVEAKRDGNTFNQKKNKEQLDKYFKSIEHMDAFLIGLSDHKFELKHDNFAHFTWLQLFNYLGDNGGNEIKFLIKELKEYKNKEYIMKKFSDNYNDTVSKVLKLKKEHYEETLKTYSEDIHDYFENIAQMLNLNFDDSLKYSNFDASDEYFLIKQVLYFNLPHRISYQIQFRVYNYENTRKALIGVLVFPKELDYDKDIDNDEFNGFKRNTHPESNNEFIKIFCKDEGFDWNNSDWVQDTRNKIVDESKSVIKAITDP